MRLARSRSASIVGSLPQLIGVATRYAHRTAVERVNSRLDVSFGFELHTIRGMAKMRVRCGLALLVMRGMALGRIRQQHPERMRSLVRSA